MDYDKTYWNRATSFYAELGLPWQWLKDGYVPVIVELKKALGALRAKRILDHACGAGKITRLLSLLYGAEVHGIDASESMIREAMKADTYGRYELLTGDFPWPDNTFDGVMSNWVFLDIGSVEEMDVAAREIYRVLKPGGPFVMLVNNEEYVGKRTSTYQNGQPDKTYSPGDDILVTYFKNGEQRIQFKDYFWPTETYSSVMGRAGFRELTSYVPKLNPCTIEEILFLQDKGVFPDVDFQVLVDETPTVIVVGKK